MLLTGAIATGASILCSQINMTDLDREEKYRHLPIPADGHELPSRALPTTHDTHNRSDPRPSFSHPPLLFLLLEKTITDA
jgi:hypothetical protein